MKKIKIHLAPKKYKHLVDCFVYHYEGHMNDALKQADYDYNDIKDKNIPIEDKEKFLKEYEGLLKYIRNFIKIYKIIGEDKEKNFDLEDDEYETFIEVLETQIGHSKNRLKDFNYDRFGWGEEVCEKLIKQETDYLVSIESVLNTNKKE